MTVASPSPATNLFSSSPEPQGPVCHPHHPRPKLPWYWSLVPLSPIMLQHSAEATACGIVWQQPQNSHSIYSESQAKKAPPANRENKRLPNASVRLCKTSRCQSTAIVYEKNPSYLKHDYKVELDTWHESFTEQQLRFWSNFWALLTKPVSPALASPCTGWLDSMTHRGTFHLCLHPRHQGRSWQLFTPTQGWWA